MHSNVLSTGLGGMSSSDTFRHSIRRIITVKVNIIRLSLAHSPSPFHHWILLIHWVSNRGFCSVFYSVAPVGHVACAFPIRFSEDNPVDSARMSIGEYTRMRSWHTLKEYSVHSLSCAASEPLFRARKRQSHGHHSPYSLCWMRMRHLRALHVESVCARVEIEATISTDKQEDGEKSLCTFSSALAHKCKASSIFGLVSASVSQSVK